MNTRNFPPQVPPLFDFFGPDPRLRKALFYFSFLETCTSPPYRWSLPPMTNPCLPRFVGGDAHMRGFGLILCVSKGTGRFFFPFSKISRFVRVTAVGTKVFHRICRATLRSAPISFLPELFPPTLCVLPALHLGPPSRKAKVMGRFLKARTEVDAVLLPSSLFFFSPPL